MRLGIPCNKRKDLCQPRLPQDADRQSAAELAALVLARSAPYVPEASTRAGVSVDVAEMCLGHSLKGVRSVYDDPREYDPHLDDAFAKVEAEVLKILSGQNLAKPVSTIK